MLGVLLAGFDRFSTYKGDMMGVYVLDDCL